MDSRSWEIGAKVTGAAVAVIGVPGAIGFIVDKLQVDISRVTIVDSDSGVPLAAGKYLISYWGLFLAALLATIVAVTTVWIWMGLGAARVRSNEAKARVAQAEAERARNERATVEA